MTRLTHSQGGFIRSLQMSSARFFGFVEGRLDRPFFDRLLAQVCTPLGITYRVLAMKELPGGTGGKSSLIVTFRNFRSRGLLFCSAFGKTMACLFFADKDADDYTRKRLRSRHLVYSPTYDLEGHLFSCGDLHRALADACGVTLTQAQQLMPTPAVWLQSTASLWKEWIALCLLSQYHAVNCGCTFDRISQVNPDPFSAPVEAQIDAFKTQLAARVGISESEMHAVFLRAVRHVEASVQAGAPLRYFKGKWLAHLVQKHLEIQPRIPDANFSGIGERLGISLVAQVARSAHCSCCAPYEQQVRVVAALL
jgi:hypothetical protein